MFKTDLPGDGFEMAVLGCRSLVQVIIIIIIIDYKFVGITSRSSSVHIAFGSDSHTMHCIATIVITDVPDTVYNCNVTLLVYRPYIIHSSPHMPHCSVDILVIPVLY